MSIGIRPVLRAALCGTALVFGGLAVNVPARAQISVGISVNIAPPILPVYVQPPIPDVGYIWTPGYWAWSDGAYYWVPGTWVRPPTVGVLWTPPYWGWDNGVYLFHAGYWGPHVGFYGGVDYGYGYGGNGFEGGRWDGDHFAYNRAVNNFGNVHVDNVYERNVTVLNNNRVSYVGGTGGLHTQPTPEQVAAEHEQHVSLTSEQTSHITAAVHNPALSYAHNHGSPAIAATAHPGQFAGAGVVRAQAAAARGPAAAPHPEARPAEARPAEARPTEARPAEPHPAAVHPAAVRPAAAPHPESRPAESRPAEARPAESHPAEPHPAAAPHPAPAEHGEHGEHKPEQRRD